MSRRTASSAGCVLTASRSSRLRRSSASGLRGHTGAVVRAPPRALGLVGDEEDLHLGLRRDDRADVAALDDGVPDRSPSARCRSRITSRTSGCRATNGHEPVDLGAADRGRDVLAGDLDAPVEAERDRMLGGEPRERDAVLEVDAVATREPGERAVHRPGVEVDEAEPARERRRDRALPRARRAVDRDDHGARS